MTNLREWRESVGLTLAETSGLTGFSIAYLSRVERDERTPPPMVKVEIARRLGVAVDVLFPPAPLPRGPWSRGTESHGRGTPRAETA